MITHSQAPPDEHANEHLWLMLIAARPSILPNLPTRDETEGARRWIREFRAAHPELPTRDIVGLTIVRLTYELWPLGPASDINMHMAVVRGIAHAARVIPLEMRVAGFVAPTPVAITENPYVLHQAGQRIFHAWREWYLANCATESTTNANSKIVYRLANEHCRRETVGAEAAYRLAKKDLDAWAMRQHGVASNIEVDDIEPELLTLGERITSGTPILTLTEHGYFELNARANRDRLRTKKLVATPNVGEPSAQGAGGCPEPWEFAARSELLARLVNTEDEHERAVIAHAGMTDIEIARLTGSNRMTINRARQRLLLRAADANLIAKPA